MLRRGFFASGLCWLIILGSVRVEAQDAAPAADQLLDDYTRAAALLQAGKPAEAVYLFYRGQMRARIYLLAYPDLPADGAPAVFASLNATLGKPINEYAFGDLPALLATLDRVLASHAAEDDPLTPKARFPEAHAQVTAGLVQLRDYVATRGETIQAQRQANGLPNRR